MAVYQLLSGEPWCWTRDTINNQTDWYLWEVVVRPAMKRSKEMEEKSNGRAKVGHGWEKNEKSLPSREQYVLIGERLGVPRAASEKEYDLFKASKKNARNTRRPS